MHQKCSSHLNLKLMNNNIDHMELSEAKLKNIVDKTVAFWKKWKEKNLSSIFNSMMMRSIMIQ